MSNLALVEQLMVHIWSEDLEPALHLCDAAVRLDVLRPGAGPDTFEEHSGKNALQGYFATLGGIVTFWDWRSFDQGNRILVLGRERYTTTGGLECGSEFALVCRTRNGLLSHILVVEDLMTLLRSRAAISALRSPAA